MKNLKQISDDVWIAGQPSEDELRSAGERFRTVVNLRTPDENGVLADEERLVEDAGMSYAPIPVSPELLDDATIERFHAAIASEGRTPALVHCQGGGRAGVLTLLHLAIKNGWGIDQALHHGEEKGILIAPDSPYLPIFEDFLRRHSPAERAPDV
ncbi:MAG TPA: protein tyrosine phosphatase family protein [Abditibacteriaceae bacterium]|jgi:uncharacterized protein (TIGR01244 family)